MYFNIVNQFKQTNKHSTGCPGEFLRKLKEITCVGSERENLKLPLFVEDLIIYIEERSSK